MTREHPLQGHSALTGALIHWLTGVSFAVILSIGVNFLGPNIPGLDGMLRDMETRGVDLAMRAQLVTGDDLGRSRTLGAGYVFFDIDPAFCARMEPAARCYTASPATPAAVARAAKALLGAGPAVVVVDAMLWGTERDDSGAASAMADLAAMVQRHRQARVVAVAPFRPTMADRGVTDFSLVPPSLLGASVAFAPSFVWRGVLETDGVLRRYPALISDSAANAKAPALQTPSLPFIAALYADANGDSGRLAAIDCRFGVALGIGDSECRVPGAAVFRVSPNLQRALAATDSDRMQFSLPSIVPLPGSNENQFVRELRGYDERFVASEAIGADGTLRMDTAQLRDKTVVVSTSAVTALDYHETPLGRMTGAEVVINAVKAFREGLDFGAPSTAARSWSETLIIAVSSVPFFFFWLLQSRWFGASQQNVWIQYFSGLLNAALYVASVAAAMVLAAAVVLIRSRQGFQEGFALEFFTPIFALSLEGFAEGSHWTLQRIERQVERLVNFAERWFGRVGKGGKNEFDGY